MSYRYYATERPLGPGCLPKSGQRATKEVRNFDDRTFVEEIGREAWGYVEYKEPLTEEECKSYELVPAGRKIYWAVMTSFYRDGKITAEITRKMEADKKPQNRQASNRKRVIYLDWFTSEEDANKYIVEITTPMSGRRKA